MAGLSLHELDRRWPRTRELMSRLGSDLLLVDGFRGREQYERYLSDGYLEGVAVFPLAGDPVTVSVGPTPASSAPGRVHPRRGPLDRRLAITYISP